METVRTVEARHIAPLSVRAQDILDDVRALTARVNEQTERVDQAIRGTIDRVDETADRVRSQVSRRARRVAGVVRGVRAAVNAVVSDRRPSPRTAHV
jgi:hypothetical protein